MCNHALFLGISFLDIVGVQNTYLDGEFGDLLLRSGCRRARGVGDLGYDAPKIAFGICIDLDRRRVAQRYIHDLVLVYLDFDSIWSRRATRIITVPAIWLVPTTRSPSSTRSVLIVPDMGL